MSKKRIEPELPYLRPEVSRELDKIKFAKETAEKFQKLVGMKKEDALEQAQKTKIKAVEIKLLNDDDLDKIKKTCKKIGGVRGKFHPSLERTRKRT